MHNLSNLNIVLDEEEEEEEAEISPPSYEMKEKPHRPHRIANKNEQPENEIHRRNGQSNT